MRESNRLAVKEIEKAIRKAIDERKSAVMQDGAGLRLKIEPTGKSSMGAARHPQGQQEVRRDRPGLIRGGAP